MSTLDPLAFRRQRSEGHVVLLGAVLVAVGMITGWWMDEDTSMGMLAAGLTQTLVTVAPRRRVLVVGEGPSDVAIGAAHMAVRVACGGPEHLRAGSAQLDDALDVEGLLRDDRPTLWVPNAAGILEAQVPVRTAQLTPPPPTRPGSSRFRIC